VRRDYRDTLIEDLVDRELALRTQWRIERAALLDRIDELSRQLQMTDSRSLVHRAHSVIHREDIAA
jgi:hypothetical protein